MLKIDIVRIDVPSRKTCEVIDYVAEEIPLQIVINKTPYATLRCSPSNLKELTIGHLLSEGILKSIDEIEELSLRKEETVCRVRLKRDVSVEKRLRLSRSFSRVIFSACGGRLPFRSVGRQPKIQSDFIVKAEVIMQGVGRLNSDAQIFRKTGGVHVAALYLSDGSLKALAEDVGRHNAVDKVIGACALDNTDFSRCFLALSGRLSGDIVLKAARVGLPIVGSLAAAIDSGIAVAKNAHLTLIGFVRGNRMNVYSVPERISF
jgi:formate dehydrogenase accessory protein FdhD